MQVFDAARKFYLRVLDLWPYPLSNSQKIFLLVWGYFLATYFLFYEILRAYSEILFQWVLQNNAFTGWITANIEWNQVSLQPGFENITQTSQSSIDRPTLQCRDGRT